MDVQTAALRQLAAEIVSAFVSQNPVSPSEVGALLADTYRALESAGRPSEMPAIKLPAVPIKKSVTADFIVSLEDGRRYKTLKRHLARLGMTPDQYRKRWDLPSDYPMVAANYAKQRAELAKAIGLGRATTKMAGSRELEPPNDRHIATAVGDEAIKAEAA